MRNNPSLVLVNVNAYTKLGLIHKFDLKILSENEILTAIKGHNSVIHLRKLMRNDPNLDLVNINAYTKFGQNPFISSEDIQWKQNSDIIQGP